MLLSPHFTLAEMVVTSFRCYDNTPNDRQLDNLSRLCNEQLEDARRVWGKPVVVTSGFRCRDIETAIHGGTYPPRGSQHGDGCAADIHPVGLDLVDAFEQLLASGIPFDQAILEKPTKVGGWIHISRPRPGASYRRDILVTHDGKTYQTYAPRVA